jgi:phosphoribosylformimino-5-aminoimidazole carboxamide ribotide isomerase
MNIFPAIDLYGGKAVRLYKGDYAQMTVYADNPTDIARDFLNSGAKFIHVVDLEGAKSGETPNFEVIKKLVESTDAFIEVGGGIRDLATVKKYLDIGVGRVILGTAALTDKEFLCEALKQYGEKIAVGVDIKDGFVAIKGWTEKSDTNALEFCIQLEKMGVKTVICTDISKDGAMKGTNRALYKEMSEKLGLNLIASGGVSSIDDIKALLELGLYGAIIGKAYYTGAINLKEAIDISE